MSKPLLGLLLGSILGLIDGASAYLYPYEDVRKQIIEIMLGSTFKGLLTGVLAGWIAIKMNSLTIGVLAGLVIGGILSYLVAMMPNEKGGHYYWEIIPPGMALGAIVGFSTQKFGRPPLRTAKAS